METVKHVQAIEYRNKTEPPTEPGWYYARIKERFGSEVRPYRVNNAGVGSKTTLVVWGQVPLDCFDWFGPVRIVKEG